MSYCTIKMRYKLNFSIKSKCYDYITSNYCSKKIKGIKKSVVNKNITHDDFKNCVLN